MQLTLRHTGKVDKRAILFFNNPELYAKHLNSLIGKEFELIIREKPKDTTKEQLNYYFGVILKVAYASEQFGHYNQSSDLHEQIIEPMFLTDYEVRVKDGKRVLKKVVSRLSQMSRQETASLIEKAKIFFESEGITYLQKENYYITK